MAIHHGGRKWAPQRVLESGCTHSAYSKLYAPANNTYLSHIHPHFGRLGQPVSPQLPKRHSVVIPTRVELNNLGVRERTASDRRAP
jgi:hypothetical protein